MPRRRLRSASASRAGPAAGARATQHGAVADRVDEDDHTGRLDAGAETPRSSARRRPGPMMRPALNDAELRPTALGRSSALTSSQTNDCRTGASKAVADAEEQRDHVDVPLLGEAGHREDAEQRPPGRPSSPGRSAAAASSGSRSATAPAYGESSRIGRNCSPVVMPRAVPLLSLSSSTSQSWATRCIQVPMFETKPPVAVEAVVAVGEGAEGGAQAVAQSLQDRGGLPEQGTFVGGQLTQPAGQPGVASAALGGEQRLARPR